MLQSMTKTKNSAGGGGGVMRDSPPTKAYRAATMMQQSNDSPFVNQRFIDESDYSPSPEFKLRTKRMNQ